MNFKFLRVMHTSGMQVRIEAESKEDSILLSVIEPIEFYLSQFLKYVVDKCVGKECNKKRIIHDVISYVGENEIVMLYVLLQPDPDMSVRNIVNLVIMRFFDLIHALEFEYVV